MIEAPASSMVDDTPSLGWLSCILMLTHPISPLKWYHTKSGLLSPYLGVETLSEKESQGISLEA